MEPGSRPGPVDRHEEAPAKADEASAKTDEAATKVEEAPANAEEAPAKIHKAEHISPATQRANLDPSKGVLLARPKDVALVVKVLTKFGVRREDLEDELQNLWLAAWESLGRFDPSRASFRTWVTHIAEHLAQHYSRAVSRRPPHLDVDDEQVSGLVSSSCAESPEEQVMRAQDRQQVRATLGRMEPDPREILEAVYMDDATIGEVARNRGANPNTLKTGLAKAKEQFDARHRKQGRASCIPPIPWPVSEIVHYIRRAWALVFDELRRAKEVRGGRAPISWRRSIVTAEATLVLLVLLCTMLVPFSRASNVDESDAPHFAGKGQVSEGLSHVREGAHFLVTQGALTSASAGVPSIVPELMEAGPALGNRRLLSPAALLIDTIQSGSPSAGVRSGAPADGVEAVVPRHDQPTVRDADSPMTGRETNESSETGSPRADRPQTEPRSFERRPAIDVSVGTGVTFVTGRALLTAEAGVRWLGGVLALSARYASGANPSMSDSPGIEKSFDVKLGIRPLRAFKPSNLHGPGTLGERVQPHLGYTFDSPSIEMGPFVEQKTGGSLGERRGIETAASIEVPFILDPLISLGCRLGVRMHVAESPRAQFQGKSSNHLDQDAVGSCGLNVHPIRF
jgi:RNA polymerase sigma-70 factor (ECF subfamily)